MIMSKSSVVTFSGGVGVKIRLTSNGLTPPLDPITKTTASIVQFRSELSFLSHEGVRELRGLGAQIWMISV